jgi:hypothetical protein
MNWRRMLEAIGAVLAVLAASTVFALAVVVMP